MTTPGNDNDIDSILTELKTLRLQQAQELHVLLHNHRQQENRLMLRLENATLQRQYHDAVESSSFTDSSIEEVPPPVPVTPVETIPVATRIATSATAYDTNNENLHVGDDVEVLNAGTHNDVGDHARIVHIHDKRHNWIRISMYGTEVETHRVGTNLRLLYHDVDPSETSP